jgi:hypothetical protein
MTGIALIHQRINISSLRSFVHSSVNFISSMSTFSSHADSTYPALASLDVDAVSLQEGTVKLLLVVTDKMGR